MSSRRRAGLRQYRSCEGLRKRSSLGQRRQNPLDRYDSDVPTGSRALCKGEDVLGGNRCNRCPAPLGLLEVWGVLSNETDPAPGPLARDGPLGQGFAATGLAAALHQQVAISMAKPEQDVGGPRRQRQKWRAYIGGHSEQHPFNGA